MTTLEKIEAIGSKYMLRIEKWKEEEAWRVGIDWYSEDKCSFVCEQKTLKDAVDRAYAFVMNDLEFVDATDKP